eukprot:403350031
MLVQTDYCFESGKGTSMYSRRGAETIAQHLCFRTDRREHYKKLQRDKSERQKFQYQHNFKNLKEIKEYMDQSTREYQESKYTKKKRVLSAISNRDENRDEQSEIQKKFSTIDNKPNLLSQQPQKDQISIQNTANQANSTILSYRDSYLNKTNPLHQSNATFYRYNPIFTQVKPAIPTVHIRNHSVKQEIYKKLRIMQNRKNPHEEVKNLTIEGSSNIPGVDYEKNSILRALRKKFKQIKEDHDRKVQITQQQSEKEQQYKQTENLKLKQK